MLIVDVLVGCLAETVLGGHAGIRRVADDGEVARIDVHLVPEHRQLVGVVSIGFAVDDARVAGSDLRGSDDGDLVRVCSPTAIEVGKLHGGCGFESRSLGR